MVSGHAQLLTLSMMRVRHLRLCMCKFHVNWLHISWLRPTHWRLNDDFDTNQRRCRLTRNIPIGVCVCLCVCGVGWWKCLGAVSTCKYYCIAVLCSCLSVCLSVCHALVSATDLLIDDLLNDGLRHCCNSSVPSLTHLLCTVVQSTVTIMMQVSGKAWNLSY